MCFITHRVRICLRRVASEQQFWNLVFEIRSPELRYPNFFNLVIPFPWVKLVKLLGKIFVKLVPEVGIQWCYDTGCQLQCRNYKKRLCTTTQTCSLFA